MSAASAPVGAGPRRRRAAGAAGPQARPIDRVSSRPARPGPRGPVDRVAATLVDRWMMRRALALAQSAAEVGEVPVGAVVYRVITSAEAVAAGWLSQPITAQRYTDQFPPVDVGATWPRLVTISSTGRLGPSPSAADVNGSARSGNPASAGEWLVAVVAEGWNLREAASDPTGHAELLAVRAAAARLRDWRLSEWSVAVTLEPCPMCAGMLVNARVRRLVYGARDPKAGAVASLYAICSDARLNHRVEIVEGVMAGVASRQLRRFFRGRRRRADSEAIADEVAAPDAVRSLSAAARRG